MTNDQLTKHERLRLESLSQAINMCGMMRFNQIEPPNMEQIFECAVDIETFLKASNPN